MGTRNRRKHPSITIHISRAQNSIWFRESPDHKQMLFGSENYSGKKQNQNFDILLIILSLFLI
jgi:hypothetical protein